MGEIDFYTISKNLNITQTELVSILNSEDVIERLYKLYKGKKDLTDIKFKLPLPPKVRSKILELLEK